MLSCHLYTFVLTLYQLASPLQFLLCIFLFLIFLSVINQLPVYEGHSINAFLDYFNQYILFLGVPMFPKSFSCFLFLFFNIYKLYISYNYFIAFHIIIQIKVNSFPHFLTVFNFASFDFFGLNCDVISVLF